MTLQIIGFIIFKILMAVTFGVIVFKVIMLIKKKSYEMHEKHRNTIKSNAVNILKERFASGEIDDKEYNEKLEFLKTLQT